jgi:SAM-dependent methyltransferase
MDVLEAAKAPVLKLRNTLALAKRAVNLSLDSKQDRALYRRNFSEESIGLRRFYNISAGGHYGFGGNFSHPFWTNVDYDRHWERGARTFDPRIDIAHDLLSLKELPIDSGTAEIVHSRYSIEHLTDEAVAFFFREAMRILKPGGILRLIAPNIELDYRAYKRGDRSFFFWQPPDRALEEC